MRKHEQIVRNKQLIAEGKDCQRFVQAFLQHAGLADDVQVHDYGGIDDLGQFLKFFCKAPGFETVISLGILRDAENAPGCAFQSVCSALSNSGLAGLAIPSSPLVPAGANPKVSVFILPDPENEGMLEHLCLRSVHENAAMECVEQYFRCLESSGTEPVKEPKARVQAYLASLPKPGLRLGEAAEKGYWPWESPVFDQLRGFLKEL